MFKKIIDIVKKESAAEKIETVIKVYLIYIIACTLLLLCANGIGMVFLKLPDKTVQAAVTGTIKYKSGIHDGQMVFYRSKPEDEKKKIIKGSFTSVPEVTDPDEKINIWRRNDIFILPYNSLWKEYYTPDDIRYAEYVGLPWKNDLLIKYFLILFIGFIPVPAVFMIYLLSKRVSTANGDAYK